jgi:hypothetical protein
MAGFCRNCGSPLGDGQSFCTSCGKPISGSSPRAATPASAPPPAAPPAPRPQAAPVAQAAAPSKGGSTLLKVLLGLVIVVFLFAAVGITGVWYLAHRIKQKAHDLGLDQMSETARSNEPVLRGGRDACSLLSKEDVGQVVKMTVVRAEATEGQGAGCTYSVQGEMTDLVAKHASLLQKGATTEQQRQMMESFAKNIFQNANAQGGASNPEHPGESPVFVFKVDNQGARGLMSMTRMTLGRMGPAFTDLPGIADEAFDIGGAMILARKGDKILTILYMMCPCTMQDATPLAKKITNAM